MITYYSLYIEGQRNFYTYSDTKGGYNIGQWVIVEFGKKEKNALILSIEKNKTYTFKVKEIKTFIKGAINFSEKMIELFLWIKEYYLCKFEDVLNSAYPSDLKQSYKIRCTLLKTFIPFNEKEREFLNYMQVKKEIAKSTLVSKFDRQFVNALIEKGVLEEKKILKTFKREIKTFNKFYKKTSSIKLNPDQQRVRDGIINSPKKFSLIRGITGSGKTEIYIEIVKDALLNEKGAIFLLPEISLTPQMIKRFKREFSDNIAILHSKLTPKERADEWYSIYNNEKKIVLGVRSAIFAPVKDLKYIIIDEEHETTYKQDSNPRYHAKFVAIKRAELEGSKLIKASATPSIESYYYAKKGIFELYEIEKRYNNNPLPDIEIVDMKNELDEKFSKKLIEEIHKRLVIGEQVIIFLNRKGYSTFIQCKDCSHTETCPHCSVSLSYYKSNKSLKCNYCGYEKKFLGTCAKCNSENLKFSGKGTEKIELELKEYFKDARILRVDSETVKERGAYKRIYEDFLNKKYDILIGTQIISKGFHFPDVTLVGIISADSILNFPDFRAGEKTFSLIVQSAGRAGRGDKRGEVLIQTYNPEHYVIEKALNSDYKGFYEEEIEMRKLLMYPPFGRTINIIISSEDERELDKKSQIIYNNIKTNELEVYGPFRAPIYKISNRYRYQIFIKGNRNVINVYKKELLENIKEAQKDKNIRITVDVDPINLM